MTHNTGLSVFPNTHETKFFLYRRQGAGALILTSLVNLFRDSARMFNEVVKLNLYRQTQKLNKEQVNDGLI